MLEDFDRLTHPHLLIYSQDGLGLGHMRRTSSIAREFLLACPGANVLTLSDSQLGQFFGTQKNHDYLKLPSIIKIGPGRWKAGNLSVPFDDVHSIRSELIRGTVLNFRPDIFLIDHMPHGAMGELIPALEALRVTRQDTKVVLGLRDILDAPEVIEQRWNIEGAFEAVKRYYDRVLIYGMQDVFDVAAQYHFPTEIVDKLHYCGYVCTQSTARYAARARMQSLSNSREGTRLIVAMAGGGADAYPMMSALLEAFHIIHAIQPCVLVMITGPFMPPEFRHRLETRSRGLPVKLRISVSDTLSYLEAADLVVSMAGYNTTMEILRSHKRAILIPRPAPSAEQRTRAKLFEARKWVQMIEPNTLSPELVAQKVLANLGSTSGPAWSQQPDLHGVQEVTHQLLNLLVREDNPQEVSALILEDSHYGLPL